MRRPHAPPPACAHPLSAEGRSVAFGRVLTGLDVVHKIGGTFAVNLRPAMPVLIRAAGRLPEAEWGSVDKAVAADAKAAAAAAAGAAVKRAPAAK